MTAQLNLKNAGVEIIIDQGSPADTALIFEQSKALEIGLPIIAGGFAEFAVNSDITEAEDAEGLYVVTYALPWDEPDPEIVLE